MQMPNKSVLPIGCLCMGGTLHDEQICGYLSNFKSFDNNSIVISLPMWGGSCVSSSPYPLQSLVLVSASTAE